MIRERLFFDGRVQCSPGHGASVKDCPNQFFCLAISVADVYRKTIEILYAQTCSSPDGASPTVLLQQNADSIVRWLLASIAKLPANSDLPMAEIADAIAMNHPTYTMQPDLRSFQLNVATDHRSALIEWRGFSGIERSYRWRATAPRPKFCSNNPEGIPARATLLLHLSCLGRQKLIGWFNGTKVMETEESGRHVHLRIPVRNLESGVSVLEFELPNARQPGNGDSTTFGNCRSRV